jgi:hypothetical protein
MEDQAKQTSGLPGHSSIFFFFSYARQDLRGDLPEDREDQWQDLRKDLRKNPYLERFFYDLVEAVKSESGQTQVSFRGLDDIRLSDRWQDHLARALQTAGVLVALYSARYFGRPYCGKEIQVFLDRRRSMGGGDIEKIAPVLWSSKKSLLRYQLPPSTLAHIQYEQRDYPTEYHTLGLQGMMTSRRGPYRRFVQALAQRIIELAEEDPLPPLPAPPDLDRIRSAFEVAPPVPVKAPAGPHMVQFLLFEGSLSASSGPGGAREGASWQWHPFAADSREIRELTALEHLDIFENHQDGSTVPDLLGFLKGLRHNNTLCIAIFDSTFLESAEGVAILGSILAEWEIDCGIFLLYDEEGSAAASVRSRLEAWQLRRENKLLEIAGSGSALKGSLVRVVLGLQQRIMETGRVYYPIPGDGPRESPLLQGPRG